MVFYVYLTERITNLDIKPTPWRYIGSGTANYSDLSEFAESRDFNKLCLNHSYIGLRYLSVIESGCKKYTILTFSFLNFVLFLG